MARNQDALVPKTWPELSDQLTALQKQVVVWLAKNRKEPYDASRAGICSEPAVSKWGPHNIRAWVAAYLEEHPSAVLASADARRDLIRLVPEATLLIAETVRGTAGKRATPMSTRLAQWCVESVFKLADEQAKADAERTEDEEDAGADSELDGVLRLATGRG
jgi:hypothetical protein